MNETQVAIERERRQRQQDARPALLRAAYDEHQEAQLQLEQKLRRLYPPGSAVEWMRGEFIQSGAVVRHGYGTDLVVMNTRSGKSVKITAGDILRAASQRRSDFRKSVDQVAEARR